MQWLVLVTFVHLTYCQHYQELTWVLDERHISYHPVYSSDKYRFKYNIDQAGPMGGAAFLAFNTYSTVEHMGTHVDAPYHFNPSGKHMDEVPLEDLIGPLVRINITGRSSSDRNAAVLVKDLLAWEVKYGEIPDGAFVLMHSGWDRFYGDNLRYLGIENETDTHLNHPAFSGEASRWLVVNRPNIKGIGVDTVSCDLGKSAEEGHPAHQLLLDAQKVCIENLRNLEKVPECGARLYALPIMLKGGTGTQARVFAQWHDEDELMRACNHSSTVLPLSALYLILIYSLLA